MRYSISQNKSSTERLIYEIKVTAIMSLIIEQYVIEYRH